MLRKKFTLIELLVVITIISILASMLFPSFRKMQKMALQNNSTAHCKAYAGEINAYFTDVRKKDMPELTDVYGFGAYTVNGDDVRWKDPAGALRFGYPKAYFETNHAVALAGYPVTGNKYNLFDTEIAAANIYGGDGAKGIISRDSNGWNPRTNAPTNNGLPKWDMVNNDQSVILTAMYKWENTRCKKPVAFGDNHVTVTGFE